MMSKADEDESKSVASQLSDEEILSFTDFSVSDGFVIIAYVLRDYVRMRKENAKLKDSLKDAKATCSEDKCPFALDGLCDENKRLRNLLDSIKERVENTDTDFDCMYYLEMMTAEDFESIDGLYETVKAIKELVK